MVRFTDETAAFGTHETPSIEAFLAAGMSPEQAVAAVARAEDKQRNPAAGSPAETWETHFSTLENEALASRRQADAGPVAETVLEGTVVFHDGEELHNPAIQAVPDEQPQDELDIPDFMK